AGDAGELQRRHAEWFFRKAEEANLSPEVLELGEQRPELVLPELPNLREAIDRSLAAGNPELAGRLVVALGMLWVTQNPFEGSRRARGVLDAGGLSPRLEARLLPAFGSSADPAVGVDGARP